MEKQMLKKIIALTLLTVFLTSMVYGCGIKGPPRPPKETTQKINSATASGEI